VGVNHILPLGDGRYQTVYCPWSEDSKPQLADKAAQLALRDVTPAFIITELLAFLKNEKRIRPG
jgi:hypothetical protein